MLQRIDDLHADLLFQRLHAAHAGETELRLFKIRQPEVKGRAAAWMAVFIILVRIIIKIFIRLNDRPAGSKTCTLADFRVVFPARIRFHVAQIFFQAGVFQGRVQFAGPVIVRTGASGLPFSGQDARHQQAGLRVVRLFRQQLLRADGGF